MLTFDDSRYLSIQAGAVAQGPRIREVVAACLGRGADNLFFLGTGGAAILMQPAALFLQRRTTFPVFMESSAELPISGHPALGPRSIIIIPSVSGTTGESVAAMEFCKARGAMVLALVGHAETPLGHGADHAIVNFAEDDTSSESFYVQSLLVALALLDLRGEMADYAAKVATLDALPTLLLGVKRQFDPTAERHATAIAGDSYHIITAAGLCWPQAWYFGMCILEEMQWIRTRPVHASDFFHGTLELVEPGVNVMLLKGEDASRPLADRVESFARQHTDRFFMLDTRSFDMPGLPADLRGLLSPAILATALERLSAHLAVKRDHPLTLRRYYKRVAY